MLKKLVTDKISFNEFIATYCAFTHSKTIVELGVQFGDTTVELCKVAQHFEGKVYGYDFFAPIGLYTSEIAGNFHRVEAKLKEAGINSSLYKLTKIDTTTPEFSEILAADTNGNIDFAFIDADHSYDGIKNDFQKVYPLLNQEGTIILHDTFSHTGPRKFVLDLYGPLNDGTFDIINLPFGRGSSRFGLTILTKRMYPIASGGLINSHDPDLDDEFVYKAETKWYNNQIKNKTCCDIPENLLNFITHEKIKNKELTLFNFSQREAEHQVGRLSNFKSIFSTIAKEEIKGDIIEFGTFQGHSLVWLARFREMYNLQHKKIISVDSFQGLPHGSAVWSKGQFKNTTVDQVNQFLEANLTKAQNTNIILVEGWFSDSEVLEKIKNQTQQICLVHMDADLKSSTSEALNIINNIYENNYSINMYILFDDWGIHKDEVPMAFEEWLDSYKYILSKEVSNTNITKNFKICSKK